MLVEMASRHISKTIDELNEVMTLYSKANVLFDSSLFMNNS